MQIISGDIWNGEGFEKGYVALDDGIVVETVLGRLHPNPTIEGCVIPGLIDGHTHVADAGLKLTRKYTLEELVAPPNGLKHKYLRDTDRSVLMDDMGRYIRTMHNNGISGFLDFREDGVEGARMLRNVDRNAVILGRPVCDEFFDSEMDSLLGIADGVGIPSITDMDGDYADSIADLTHRKNKMLALHVSERIREDFDRVLSLEPDVIVHMVKASHDDLRKCADAGIPIVVCPVSNAYFGLTADIKDMLDCGIDVAIGTDNAMLSPNADILDDLRLFDHILTSQGGTSDQSYACLIRNGKKLLNVKSLMGRQTDNKADLVAYQSGADRLLRGSIPKALRCSTS